MLSNTESLPTSEISFVVSADAIPLTQILTSVTLFAVSAVMLLLPKHKVKHS